MSGKAWNTCLLCDDLVDCDDIFDGSEVACLGCDSTFVCAYCQDGTWVLDPTAGQALVHQRDQLQEERAAQSAELARLRAECRSGAQAKGRLRRAAQFLIDAIGVKGPEDADETARRAAQEIISLRAENEQITLALAEVGTAGVLQVHRADVAEAENKRLRAALVTAGEDFHIVSTVCSDDGPLFPSLAEGIRYAGMGHTAVTEALAARPGEATCKHERPFECHGSCGGVLCFKCSKPPFLCAECRPGEGGGQ